MGGLKYILMLALIFSAAGNAEGRHAISMENLVTEFVA